MKTYGGKEEKYLHAAYAASEINVAGIAAVRD